MGKVGEEELSPRIMVEDSQTMAPFQGRQVSESTTILHLHADVLKSYETKIELSGNTKLMVRCPQTLAIECISSMMGCGGANNYDSFFL